MSIMAQSLGYGTKIIAALINVINGDRKAEYQEKLGIPEDMEAAAILLVGKERDVSAESADAVTGASVRNRLDEMTTIVN